MRTRAVAGTLLVVGCWVTATAAGGDGAWLGRRWAVTYLAEPTLIGSTIVEGPVLFVHDDAKMARGEACTTVRLFDPTTGPAEEIGSFHCIPIARAVARRFTVKTRPNEALGFGCILMEYQFAGDTEGHGVPAPANAQ